MKTSPGGFIFRPVLRGLALLLVAGCSARKEPQPVVPPVTVPAPVTTTASNVPAPVAAPIASSETWTAIKDLNYDHRAEVVAGFERLSVEVVHQVQELSNRRAAVPVTSIQDWDFAMKELNDAQSDLQFKITQLSSANPEIWSQARDNAAVAWKRAEDAYDKVTRSTTR